MNSGHAIVQALSAGLSPHTSEFDPRPVHVEFEVDMALRIFPEYSRLPLSDPFSNCYWFIQSFIYLSHYINSITEIVVQYLLK
jgi:hypothetical protein